MTNRRTGWLISSALALCVVAGCQREAPSAEHESTPPLPAAAAAAPAPTTPEPAAVVAAAQVEKPAAPTAPQAKAAVRVRRLVITHGIENREPLAATELSAGGGPIYAFVELASGEGDAANVVVTFERGERAVGHVKLSVPGNSRRWRTWGQTRQIREAGEWQAVVRTADGEELARQSFQVK